MKPNINTYINHKMPGAIPHKMCSCGYDEVSFNTASEHCPNCKSLMGANISSLEFGKSKQNCRTIDIIGDKMYQFTIDIVDKSILYSVNFSKKKIKNIEVKDILAFRIEFNAYDREKMLCFYDIDGNEIDAKTFSKAIKYYSTELFTICINNLVGEANKFKHGKYSSEYALKSFKSVVKHLKELEKWCREPYNEILIKAGIDPALIPVGLIDKDKTDPCSILGVKKYTVKQLIKYQYDVRNCFVTLKELEDSLGDKSVSYMDKFVMTDKDWLAGHKAEKIINLINNANLSVDKLYKYLYHEAPLQQALYKPETTLNYLNDSYMMATQLELPFDKKPKALVRYHDVLAKEIKTISNQLNDKKIQQVFQTYKHLEQIAIPNEDNEYDKNNKYSIILPKNAQDIITEGKMMRHCVGSYVERVANGKCVILFVRKSNDINKPFVTMEYAVRDNSIIQIKAFANGKADKEVLDFIKKWAQNNNITIHNYH